MSNENKIYTFPSNENLSYSFDDSLRKKRDNDGGGGDMSNYVTKEELKREIELLEAKLDSKFLKIDNKFTELKLELKDQQSTNIKWLVGTAIALAGVIIAAIKLL